MYTGARHPRLPVSQKESMVMAVVCPLCENRSKTWKEHAQHVLEAHPDDEERCIWARHALEAENEQLVETAKYKGKPIEQVPVARRDKVPKIIKEKLEQADGQYAPKAGDESEAKAPKAKKARGDSSK